MSKVKNLKSLHISANFKQADTAFLPFINAVKSQADKLGLMLSEVPYQSDNNVLELIISEANGPSFLLKITTPLLDGTLCGERDLQALTGLTAVHSRSLEHITPLGIDYVSITAASLALLQLFAGLTARHRGSDTAGASLDLIQAGLLAVGQYLAGATTEKGAENFAVGEADPARCPPFLSRDGIVFELESLSPRLWQRFWEQLGAKGADIGRGWHSFMQRYAKAVAPLPAEMVALLAQRDYVDLVALASEVGVAITPVRTLSERREDADLAYFLTNGPWTIAPADETRSPQRSLPALVSPSDLPLAGLQIIESCRRIQGPMAGHILSLLGASVQRLEPLGGDPLRGMPPLAGECSARFDALNGRKDIEEVDIKSVEGRQRIAELATNADVFIHNWAPGKAEVLGLDAKALGSMNPEIIYTYAGGWGAIDDEVGIPGTDFMAQAYSGLADVIASQSGTRGGTLLTVTDIFGGILAAQAVIIALYCRAKGCSGLQVNSSLLGAATLLVESAFGVRDAQLQRHPLSQKVMTDLASLSSHPALAPYLQTQSYTQLRDLWRPL
ncbi:CoA transferase [Photobacterium nomapromontoriensis]|uniref:CoA transferase n=1 Tax=Photobacterium nomapromontoriensis TaxID=2910237 RepID=UPI003D144477